MISSETTDKDTEDIEHVPKRQCLDVGETVPLKNSVERNPAPTSAVAVDSAETSAVKRSQIVVGVKEVTKSLERGILRAVVVCLSVKPALLHEHLQVLSATRSVPCIAMHGVSEAIAPILGLKSALTIGLKVFLLPSHSSPSHQFSTISQFQSTNKNP